MKKNQFIIELTDILFYKQLGKSIDIDLKNGDDK